MAAKYLNRNSFNEKLVHRFLIENFYLDEYKIAHSFLAPKYSNKKIRDLNIVVPEKESKKNYRADLTLYFKNDKFAIPVEVKFHAKEFKQANQIKYIKENKGFLISFAGVSNKIDQDSQVVIDYAEYLKWLSLNISQISRESLIYNKSSIIKSGGRHWLVFLRGDHAFSNFQRMLANYKEINSNIPFWAFTNNSKAMRNIFAMEKNDHCIFIIGNISKAPQSLPFNKNLPLKIKAWYSTRIKTPYYMELKGSKSCFFEKSETVLINQRRWPHFIDFKLNDYMEFPHPIEFGKTGKYTAVLRESANTGGGTPAAISQHLFSSLFDKLNHISQSQNQMF